MLYNNFYCSFASSSKGNCSLLKIDGTVLLIDVGISYRALLSCLYSVNMDIHDIDAVLITHEHIDHIRGLEMLLKKHHLKVFASIGTKSQLCAKNSSFYHKINDFLSNSQFKVGSLDILSVKTSHDTIDSTGFLIRGDNYKMGFITDLGFVSDEIFCCLSGCNALVIESNYDEQMLENGPYPYVVKQRINSNHGHLSNKQCGLYSMKFAQEGTDIIILAHLSENNNTPHHAYSAVRSYLSLSGKEFVLNDNLFINEARDGILPISLKSKKVQTVC